MLPGTAGIWYLRGVFCSWLAGNGEVYSWGRGMFGRLGTGREADAHVPAVAAPAAVRQRPRFTTVTAGAYHNLTLDGSCSMPLSRPLLLLPVFVLVKAKLDIVVQQFVLGKYCLKYLQHSEFLMSVWLVESGRCTSLKRKL